MPFFFVLLMTPIAVAIALYRRNPRRFLDGPTEDAPLRLLRWAIGLLAPERAEWGRAMLGELGHLERRLPRMRFALGCTGAVLILPPWGRAAAALWTMIGITAASFVLYTGLAVRYQLGVGDWVVLGFVLIICLGYLLGTSALLRRPDVALPGLLGGTFVTAVGLALSGLTAADQVTHIPNGWQKGVSMIAVPAVVGAGGTLWRRDPAVGRRVARLAALTGGLAQLLYATIAVAILGGGGPPDQDGGFTVRGTVSDRLGNNIFHLLVYTLIIAMVGWAAAALATQLTHRCSTPAADTVQGVRNP